MQNVYNKNINKTNRKLLIFQENEIRLKEKIKEIKRK